MRQRERERRSEGFIDGGVSVIVLIFGLWLLACGMTAQAQTAAGVTIAIEPCALVYTEPLEADTPLGIHARGYCGIPEEAVALVLHLKAGGSATAGKVYVWPHGEAIPGYTQFNYVPNYAPGWPWSGHSLVRLRDPNTSGYYDLWAQSTSDIAFSAVVEGYIVPMPTPTPQDVACPGEVE